MAKGTPVVALRRGSVPEVVAHGRTGLVCDDPVDLPSALHDAHRLDPAECVAHVAASFSADLMAARYEGVYRALIHRPAALRTGVTADP
jgi:glycosyltransferase involved in cell wall biosynthesis